jgi:hypothetical protein
MRNEPNWGTTCDLCHVAQVERPNGRRGPCREAKLAQPARCAEGAPLARCAEDAPLARCAEGAPLARSV